MFSFLKTALQGNSNPGGGVLGFLNKEVVQKPVQQAKEAVNNLKTSPIATGARVIAAEATSNPVARANASKDFNKSIIEAGSTVRNPQVLGSIYAGDGIEGEGAGLVKPATVSKLASTADHVQVNKTLVKSGVKQDVADRISPAIAQTKDPNIISNIINKAHEPTPAPTPVSKPIPKAVETAPLPDKAPLTKGPDESMYESIAHDYTDPQQLANDIAETHYSYDKSAKGGMIQRVSAEGGIGQDSFIKTTEHTPFYSQYYKEHGRAPTLKTYQQQVHNELDGHSGPLVAEDEKSIYQNIKDRQDSNDAIGSTEPLPFTGKTNQRSFLDTIKNAPNINPETKEAVSELPQQYQVKQNQPLFEGAQRAVEADPEGALDEFLGKDHLSDQDAAVGQQLLRKASNEGDTANAVRIASHLDTNYRESGRTIQTAARTTDLSPEGILQQATKRIRAARDDKLNDSGYINRGYKDENKTAGEIRDAVEGAPSKEDVTQAVRKTASDLGGEHSGETRLPNARIPAGLPAKPGEGQLDISGGEHSGEAEELSTGEKVAKKIETTVEPKLKKKPDQLVNEIVKKVRQEQLAPRAATKRSALDIMKEVFQRNHEAQEAFPEAQRILLDKFKDNPRITEQLQTFFKSKLGLPAASSTINRAIRDQLSKNETRISDVIHKSWAAQKTSVDEVAQALVKDGFDKESAQAISKEVTTRLEKQLTDSKTARLNSLAKETPKRARPTYLDKVTKLSNLGALDKQDYLDLARSKLGLPNLTEDTAKDISALAQKIQGLPDGAERRNLIRQVDARIKQELPVSLKDKAVQVLGAPKTTLATGDFSGGGRQGAVLGARFPKEFKNAVTSQVDYFRSQDHYDNAMAEIANRPTAPIHDRMKLALGGRDHPLDEAFVSGILEGKTAKGVGVGHVIAASDRAYTGLLTKLRADVADRIIGDLTRAGIDVNKMSDKQLEDIGRFINTASGRGGKPGGWLERNSEGVATALFSPRLWKSRLDLLNPIYYAQLDPVARKYAIQSAASFAGVASTILGLATLAGAQVETDPRSSDFLKIKVGNARFDILGGLQQNIVLAWRELKGEEKSSQTGAVTKLGSGFGTADRLSILYNFIQNKENPAISTASQILKGKDGAGNKINPLTAIASLAIPLSGQDAYQLYKDRGPSGIPLAVPGLFGVGEQDYSSSSVALSDKQKSYLNKLKKDGAPAATVSADSAFFQALKVAAGTNQNVSDEIDKAIAAHDLPKARSLADAYNQHVVDGLKKWNTQYGQQYANSDLRKAHRSVEIKLTSESIKSRERALKNATVPYNKFKI